MTEAIAETLPGADVSKACNVAQARGWERGDMTWDAHKLVVPFSAAEGAAALVIKQLFAGADPFTVLNLIQPETKPI